VPDSQDQYDLFGSPSSEPEPIAPAAPNAELDAIARRMPAALRFGTSNWAFPGWTGLVYAHRASEPMLARDGLRAYSRHPLLRTVGADRAFHTPVSAGELARMAECTPPDFRFVLKAHASVTTPFRQFARLAAIRPDVDHFLDPAHAIERIIAPAVEGLGSRLGVLLFQFPPLGYTTRDLHEFPVRLGRFLEQLPRGPQYAVEVRNREVLGESYADALARSGVTHCFNVYPRMPDVLAQAQLVGESAWLSGAVVVRWALHPEQDYEAARERFFPFHKLADPDAKSRSAVAELLETLLARGSEVFVIAGNKAEGCAPLTLFTLAKELDRRCQPQPQG
jgi:uncharacterized protein YecE (DUF72 family)